MATIYERNGKFQVKIRRDGKQESKTFSKKTDAEAWARKVESEIERGEWYDLGEADKTTLSAALDRYQKEKTEKKKSKKRETVRVNSLKANLNFAKKPLSKIGSDDIAKFVKNERDRGLSDSSIRLDLALLSSLFKTAAQEWKMPGLRNPVSMISKPKASPGRIRRLVDDEEIRLLNAIEKAMPRTHNARALCVLAIETGMRESELLGLKRADIVGRLARLRDTKNGTPRDVPLSKKAAETIENLLTASAQPKTPDDKLFELTQDRLVRGFKKACDKAEIEDLVFHDLRHEAASRMAKIYQAHELAKIFGWKTIQMAMRYYHPDALDFVAKLDAAGASA